MKKLLTELKRVPRSSWATLLMAGLVFVSNISCIAFEMSWEQMAYLDGWLTECEAYLCANDGCNTAKLLWDTYEWMLESGTPDSHGTAVRQMLNALWDYPDQQAQLESLVRNQMGDSWFSLWVGEAIGRFMTGGWFTVYVLPIVPGDINFCAAWCETARQGMVPPPGCICGGITL